MLPPCRSDLAVSLSKDLAVSRTPWKSRPKHYMRPWPTDLRRYEATNGSLLVVRVSPPMDLARVVDGAFWRNSEHAVFKHDRCG
jgi:hypothetical protein